MQLVSDSSIFGCGWLARRYSLEGVWTHLSPSHQQSTHAIPEWIKSQLCSHISQHISCLQCTRRESTSFWVDLRKKVIYIYKGAVCHLQTWATSLDAKHGESPDVSVKIYLSNSTDKLNSCCIFPPIKHSLSRHSAKFLYFYYRETSGSFACHSHKNKFYLLAGFKSSCISKIIPCSNISHRTSPENFGNNLKTSGGQ